MKIIDKNGRLFGKVSVIDVVVLLLVIVLAVALRHKAQLPQTGTKPYQTSISYLLWGEENPVWDLLNKRAFTSDGVSLRVSRR